VKYFVKDSIFSSERASNETDSVRLTYVLFLLSCVILTFAPVIVGTYAFQDDYLYLQTARDGFRSMWVLFAAGGRPLLIVPNYLSFAMLSTVSGLSFVRAATVVDLCVLAVVIYFALSKAGFPTKSSALLAFILVTLPPFQIVAAVSGCAVFPLVAAVAGVASFLVMQSTKDVNVYVKFGRLGVACLLLLAGMMVHQPEVMFFWIFVAIFVFRPREPLGVVIQKISYSLVVGAVACIAEFFVARIAVAVYGPAAGSARAGITHDVLGKIHWFINEPLKNALNLNSIDASERLAITISVFIVVGLFFYFGGSLRYRLAMLGIALMLIPLAYLPNLVVLENWATYRTQVALTALFAFYTFLALNGFLQLLKKVPRDGILVGVVACWAVFSGFAATRHLVRYFVEPQSAEYHLLKGQLKKIDLAAVQTIYIIRSNWDDGLTSFICYDEFGLPSSCEAWVPSPMVKCAIREIGGNSDRINVISFAHDEPEKVPAGATVIDMRMLRQFR
jgi:hypothetical protein